MKTSQPAIILMTKAPIPGKSKTRLHSHLLPDMCARLQEAFIKDMGILLNQLPYHQFVSYTPAGSEEYFKKEVPVRGGYFPQPEGDLGQRMLFSIEKVWKQGFSPIIVIGSDLPTLQPIVFQRALTLLKQSDVCLGPTFDGGYYLIGLHKPIRSLFDQVPWSGSEVFSTTLRRSEEEHLKATSLDCLSDIDIWEDLSALYQQLDSSSIIPSNTSKILQEIFQQAEMIVTNPCETP